MRTRRFTWADLSPGARTAVQHAAGARVVATHGQDGGYTTGVAARLELADGRALFLKGLTDHHELAGMYRNEAAVNAVLPPLCPSPRLLWSGHESGWLLQLFAYVPGRHPDLRPGSPDLPAVLEAVGGLSRLLTPCPYRDAVALPDSLASEFTGWRHLASHPANDLDTTGLPPFSDLVAAETRCRTNAAGNALVHTDLRADNVLITPGRAWVIDWAWAARGAAWHDPASLVPQLILAGHPPGNAERAMESVPAWWQVCSGDVTDFAIAMTGYWEAQRRRPGLGADLQAYRARAARAGRAWIAHRLRSTGQARR